MFWTLSGTLGESGADDPPPGAQDVAANAPSDPAPPAADAAPAKPARVLPAIPVARTSQVRPAAPADAPALIPLGRAGAPAAPAPAQPIPLKQPAAAPERPAEAAAPTPDAAPIPLRHPGQDVPRPAAPAVAPPAIPLKQPADAPLPIGIKPAAAPEPAPEPAAPKPAAEPQPAVPRLGTFQAQKSKYYSNMVVDPVSGVHYDADTGKASEVPAVSKVEHLEREHASATARQIGIALAALLGIAVITAAVTRVTPQYAMIWLGISTFIGGMVLPILGAVPFGEDDSTDVPIGIGLFLAFGPVVGAIFYAVAAAIRSVLNPAILGIAIAYVIMRVPIDAIAGGGPFQLFQSLMPFTKPPSGVAWPMHILSLYLTFAGMAGWYAAGAFHKLDE